MLFLVNTITLARVIGQEKINTRQPDGKIKVKQPVFVDNMILYTETPKESSKNKKKTMWTNKQVQKCDQIEINKQINCILHTSTEQSASESKKTTPFIIVAKRIKHLG